MVRLTDLQVLKLSVIRSLPITVSIALMSFLGWSYFPLGQIVSDYKVLRVNQQFREIGDTTARELSTERKQLEAETMMKDILSESMIDFKTTITFKAKGLENSKQILSLQLSSANIAKDVVKQIIETVLINEIEICSGLERTVTELETKGKASYYIMKFCTGYDSFTDTYNVNLATTGISFIAAEIVAGYEETKTERLIGSEPCHCGAIRCEKCPIFTIDVLKTPVFKRHILTFYQQRLLASSLRDEVSNMMRSAIPPPVHALSSFTASFLLDAPKNNNQKELTR